MVKFSIKNVTVLSLLFFGLLFLRRGMQLLYPQIWNEDGPFNMGSFILHGWYNLFEPTQGYLVLIPKLITDISLSISFVYYPEVSTYLTWIFTIVLALTVVYVPTMLQYRVFAAIWIFLIPTNAEAYGLPLYTLWFSAIMLFLVALWQPGTKQVVKNFLLTIGGFSSPTIVIIIPVQIFRLIVLPSKKEELVTLLMSIIIAAIQLSFILHHGVGAPVQINTIFIQNIVVKFFGYYYLGAFDLPNAVYLVGGIYLIVLIAFFTIKNRKDIFFMILVYLLAASIAMSVARMNPAILTPIFGGGARYFFLPYILLSWILLYIMAKNRWYEKVIIPVMFLSILSALQGFCRTHEDLQWRKHIALCAESNGKYYIPVQNDGKAQYAWHMVLDGKTCRTYISNDLFDLPREWGMQ